MGTSFGSASTNSAKLPTATFSGLRTRKRLASSGTSTSPPGAAGTFTLSPVGKLNPLTSTSVSWPAAMLNGNTPVASDNSPSEIDKNARRAGQLQVADFDHVPTVRGDGKR